MPIAAVLLSLAAQGGARERTGLPAYSKDVREFRTVTKAVFTMNDRRDKKVPFAAKPMTMVQACPLGYVGAKHPTIRDYDQQFVSSQSFVVYVDGVAMNGGETLPFVEKPKKGQTNFWTLDGEATTGWDANAIVFTPKAGATKIEVVSTYEGLTGSNQWDPSVNTGVKLSAQERKEFSRLDEVGTTVTKAQMDAVLNPYGLLRSEGERSATYVARLDRWMSERIRYRLSYSNDSVLDAIANCEPGNCNHKAKIIVFALRSQGVPARVTSGMLGDNREHHGVAEWFDESSGRWYRCGGDGASIIGKSNENILIFEADQTIQYVGDVFEKDRKVGARGAIGCGRWMNFQSGSYVGKSMGFLQSEKSSVTVR